MAEEFTVQLRVPEQIKQGDVIEVKVKIKHPSRTGLQLIEDAKTPFDRFVRNQPAEYIREVEVFYGDQSVSLFEMNSATSDDPLLAFKLRAEREAPLRVAATNHRRETVEATADIHFSA
ncbi:MAG: thiosulfate oxidation carrier complex protein SoxZ [Chloroflexi bacterium]|nr:thiosulfate oxidation carrier complex protein SoxZ [Chloroflexota bacterium]